MPIKISIVGLLSEDTVEPLPGSELWVQVYPELTLHELINSFMDGWEGNIELPGQYYAKVKKAVSKVCKAEYGGNVHSTPFGSIPDDKLIFNIKE